MLSLFVPVHVKSLPNVKFIQKFAQNHFHISQWSSKVKQFIMRLTERPS